MIDLTTPIVPYKGTGIFELDANYVNVKTLLDDRHIPYDEEVSKPNDIDPPWYIITISKEGSQFPAIELFFAKNRMFKICLCEDFDGELPNGIHTGMTIETALNIDKNLCYNDDKDEIYESPDGYWLDYYRGSRKIMAITVFIPAFDRDDFFEYNW